ncbi:hypothetical protein EV702DRAFT_1041027 [Suillus placidus]|uniref:Uncharacterized protein n=1 Tax=Suillus placidus TaxID=48579 RepID=A0A9P7A6G1_9AGAM|nr:hypothetical protein EV702DRAFT_1041027 [Suillus placidus]
MPYSTTAIAYLTTVKQKCKSWLRRQCADSSFKRQLYLNDSTSSAMHQLTGTHLECQTSVIVNVRTIIDILCLAVLTVSFKSTDPSFCLLSTWVPPDVQDALNDTRKSELSTQAGLMTMYLDIDGYNSHQCNIDSELLYLWARMHRAKAEVALYKLAIENAPASNFPDNVSDALAASSSSSSRPNPTPHLPEDFSRYKEYINAESLDDGSSEHLWCRVADEWGTLRDFNHRIRRKCGMCHIDLRKLLSSSNLFKK